jgi:conjugal transfer pilus assembly protein TraA
MKKLSYRVIKWWLSVLAWYSIGVNQVRQRYKSYFKSWVIFFGLLAGMLFFQEAFAGTDGDDFADIYTKLQQWSQGSLGKVVSLGMFLVGLSIGVIQQSIIAVVIGISGAMALYYGPNIISSVVSAVI